MEYLNIDAAYLAAKMKEHNLTQKAAATAICGGDDSMLRKWLAGRFNMSTSAKAAIFYYFQLIELLNKEQTPKETN